MSVDILSLVRQHYLTRGGVPHSCILQVERVVLHPLSVPQLTGGGSKLLTVKVAAVLRNNVTLHSACNCHSSDITTLEGIASILRLVHFPSAVLASVPSFTRG